MNKSAVNAESLNSVVATIKPLRLSEVTELSDNVAVDFPTPDNRSRLETVSDQLNVNSPLAIMENKSADESVSDSRIIETRNADRLSDVTAVSESVELEVIELDGESEPDVVSDNEPVDTPCPGAVSDDEEVSFSNAVDNALLVFVSFDDDVSLIALEACPTPCVLSLDVMLSVNKLSV